MQKRIITPSAGRLTVARQTNLGVAVHDVDDLYSPDSDVWRSKVLDPVMPKYAPSKSYWFDGSRFSNPGTITGAVWVQLPSSIWVLSFDGADDQVNFGNKAAFNFTTTITIRVWVRPSTLTTLNATAIFVSKVDNYYFGFQKTTGMLRGRVYAGVEKTAASGALAAGKFAHCCLTYDGSALTFYKDAVAIFSAAQAGVIATGVNSLYAGTDATGAGGFFFPGLMGKPLICSRAFTAAEVVRDRELTKWRYQ